MNNNQKPEFDELSMSWAIKELTKETVGHLGAISRVKCGVQCGLPSTHRSIFVADDILHSAAPENSNICGCPRLHEISLW